MCARRERSSSASASCSTTWTSSAAMERAAWAPPIWSQWPCVARIHLTLRRLSPSLLSAGSMVAPGEAATPTRFAAGQLIIGPGPGAERVYVTRSGTVRLFRRPGSGREVTVERLDPGHLFGVTLLLGKQADELMAEAETDVEVCVVEQRV